MPVGSFGHSGQVMMNILMSKDHPDPPGSVATKAQLNYFARRKKNQRSAEDRKQGLRYISIFFNVIAFRRNFTFIN